MSEEDPVEEIEKTAEKAEAKPREQPRITPEKKKVKKPSKKAPTTPEAAPKPSKAVYKKLKVNFWRTRLHDEELGVHQQLKYQAKTRWFSKNFDIEGVIEEDGEKKYIIAFSKDDWEEKPLEEKRLTCRLFTIMEERISDAKEAKGGNFKGGVELSVAHSLIQSYEIKHPAPVFIMQIPRTIYLARCVRGWRLVGTYWAWPLLPEQKDDKLQVVRAKGIVGPGRNYWIYIGDQKVARIDGQVVQKNFEIEIFDQIYAKDKMFVVYMALFGCICNFMRVAEKMIKKLYKKMKKTATTDYKIPRQELTLFRNPRMMRR
ncbi:MAG: hypothetical protein JSV62_00635 [Promethearchaeota archaeon]|nr:MAG: hypothetical protein JSV62_00635 [Candidatus Lokiarchaeota archaeon]